MGCKSIPQGFAETLRCAFWVLLASCFGTLLAASATQVLLLQALEASPEPQEGKLTTCWAVWQCYMLILLFLVVTAIIASLTYVIASL